MLDVGRYFEFRLKPKPETVLLLADFPPINWSSKFEFKDVIGDLYDTAELIYIGAFSICF